MPEILKRRLTLPVALLLCLAATWSVRNHPFFWDTVQLASKHAHFFYENNFASLLLPEEIDSGHPPVFGMYLAAVWTIFGKSLPASHFAMLPFLFGIVFFLYKIGEKLSANIGGHWLLLPCFADPVLAGQGVLVSPDLALVFFFLMGLWAVWERKKGWLVLSVTGLGLLSMRGMMTGLGLYLFSLFTEEKIDVKSALRRLLPFLPGGLIAGGWLFYHWHATGWIGYHEQSAWAPSFERVGWQGFIKNMAVLGWRMLDYGRLTLWALLAISVVFFIKNSGRWLPAFDRKNMGWQLAALFIIMVMVLVPSQLLHKGLLAHRYLLPIFLALNLFVFHLIAGRQGNQRSKRACIVALSFGLALGNYWIYPKKISQGWDSTLAHLPWYSLIADAEAHLLENDIPYHQVGTAFPNIGPRENFYLNGIEEGFERKDLSTQCYILYSNIMNDFTDEELDELDSPRWAVVFRQDRGGVCVILYKNKTKEGCEN